ncbi:hypothetical protein AB0N05_05365 [Nocardia sp. NPDC051030]|uniref:hypothetical protein n=1 Tax=Nocardia sp. NPDC051030 TaxID=3155162 RepID=UPI003421D772
MPPQRSPAWEAAQLAAGRKNAERQTPRGMHTSSGCSAAHQPLTVVAATPPADELSRMWIGSSRPMAAAGCAIIHRGAVVDSVLPDAFPRGWVVGR